MAHDQYFLCVVHVLWEQMARKLVWVEAQIYICLFGSKLRLNGSCSINNPLLIVKRILDSRIGTSFLNVPIFSRQSLKIVLARVYNVRNCEVRMNPVIFTVSNPFIP